MKYVLRLSYLPPLAIYVELGRDATSVLAALCNCAKGVGKFQFVHRVLDWLELDCLQWSPVEIVEDRMFTENRDADILIIKTDKVFDVHHLTDAMDRELRE